MTALEDVTWPLSRLGEALAALARASALPAQDVNVPAPPADIGDPNELVLAQWIDGAAGWLGLEVEPVETTYAGVASMIHSAAPAVLRIPGDPLELVLLLGAKRGTARVIDREGVVRTIAVETLRARISREVDTRMGKRLEPLLNTARVPDATRERVKRAMMFSRVGALPQNVGWLLRERPGASFWRQCRRSGLVRRALIFLIAHAAAYGLWIAAWWTVGRGAFEGQMQHGWLYAWGLLLLTLVPFRFLASWAGGILAIDAGALLKQRLLGGALQLEPEEARHQGAGQLLGRVLESEAVETLAIGGGLNTFVSIIELVIAGLVIAAGAGGWTELGWFLAWTAITVFTTGLYLRRRDRWTSARVEMTHDLVERIVGHRTRLAQERRDQWHDVEDQLLDRYLRSSSELDRAQLVSMTLLPRGWLLAGIAALTPAVVDGAPPALLAVSLGGVILAYRAFRSLSGGMSQLAGALIAWEQIKQIYRAAARAERVPPAGFSWKTETSTDNVLVEAHKLSFKYPDRPEAVLHSLNLQIRAGEKVLVEGASGSGKSTLAALLAGLRLPQQGLLLLGGLDRPTLGIEGWRRRVVAAPQFHENHVLSGTFAFNLLMGRRWPATPSDLEEAETVCRALGLGPLLERMPAGFRQAIGETGWQLSHGERSRLYVARALLQGAELVLLDESFAALDPETIQKAVGYVLAQKKTLIVIAHP